MNWIKASNHLLIFLAGFLSFSIQLLETKAMLPLLGGSSSIWIGSLMFFQIALLVSYGVTFKISQTKNLRGFFLTLVACLGGALATSYLPLNPNYPLLALITKLIPAGLIFISLLQISPLIQFFSKEENPYRYYASSNFGAFVGLLSYPFVFEGLMGLTVQKDSWIALSIGLILVSLWSIQKQKKEENQLESPSLSFSDKGLLSTLGYAAAGTFFLGSYSALVSEDISGFPLLWVIPLLLYLLAFAIVFGPEKIRKAFNKVLVSRKKILEYVIIFHLGNVFFIRGQYLALVFYVIAMFMIFLMIIEELHERAKTQHTSTFYLLIALGGALGGILNNLIPFVWPLGDEVTLGLIVLFSYLAWVVSASKKQKVRDLLVFLTFLSVFSYFQWEKITGYITIQRNFFGIVKVFDLPAKLPAFSKEPDPYESDPMRIFNHGKITHGNQRKINPKEPTTYYRTSTGLGLALDKKLQSQDSLDIGGLGLGVGTISAYGREKDRIDYYEINSLVIDIAQKYFTFIKDSPASHEFFLGDGRIELEKNNRLYDVLVIDAFSGDAIPTHLLTKEAFALYLKKLKPQGLLALHISNNYIDLQPVVEAGLRANGLRGHYVNQKKDQYASSWVIVGSEYEGNFEESKGLILWTDEKNNVLDIFDFTRFWKKDLSF